MKYWRQKRKSREGTEWERVSSPILELGFPIEKCSFKNLINNWNSPPSPNDHIKIHFVYVFRGLCTSSLPMDTSSGSSGVHEPLHLTTTFPER